MKRIHIHIRVDDLDATRRFYSALLGQEPTVVKPDYLKWMVDDPRLNLAVSPARQARLGVDHVGIQVDSDEALDQVNAQLNAAEQATWPERGANCCYAHSNKNWARDPQGVVWEMFHTMGSIPTYSSDNDAAAETIKAWTPEDKAAAEAKVRACCG
ncbi:MAG: ArsI/CadI family heavy metal resistance metalloenzyme [Pseudomonadota bacterium]